MDHVLNWIVQGAAIAAAAAVLLLALRRARARHRLALCAAALLAVLALPLLAAWRTVLTVADSAGVEPAEPVLLSLPSAWWTSDVVPVMAGLLWALVHGLRARGGLAALRRVRAAVAPFPPTLEARLVHWRSVRSTGRGARLVVSDGIRSAAVLGCGDPLIAIAPPLLDRLSVEDLDRIVVHEWAHVQRRDDIGLIALLAVRALAGWHPAIWWLERQLGIEREAACDEIVVAVTGSDRGCASSLAAVAALAPAAQRLPVAGATSPGSLERRVRRILAIRRLAAAPRSAAAAGTAILGIAAGFVAVAGVPMVLVAAGLAPPAPVPLTVIRAPQPPSAAIIRSSGRQDGRQVVPAGGTSRTRARARVERRGPVASERLSAAPGTVTAPAVPARALAPPIPSRRLARTPPTDTGPAALAARAPSAAAGQDGSTGGSAAAFPWTRAAGAGAAIGNGSHRAASATAGLFRRVGKNVAASF